MTYGVRNPDPGLGQTQKCGMVKPGNCLQVIIGDYFFKKQVLDIYNINVVSINFKFMCTRLLTGIKVTFTEPFPSIVLNTHKIYALRHCINIVFILPKNYINP